MSKKRDRARRRKKQRAAAAALDPSTLRERTLRQLEAALDENLPRRAWSQAKGLIKDQDLAPPHRALVIRALDARVRQMLNDDHAAEAVALFDSVLARCPDWRALLPADTPVLLECVGAEPVGLRRYEGSADVRAAVDPLIRQCLRNPQWLADNSSLPPEHPLRRDAALIMAAWTEVEETGKGLAFSALRRVPRRSPLSHWRLFVQALAAYYDRNDDRCHENLRRIPEDSATAPLALILADLCSDRRPGCAVAKEIRQRTSGVDLLGRLRAIQKAMDEDRWGDALTAAERLCRYLEQRGWRSLALDVAGLTVHCLLENDMSYGLASLRFRFAHEHAEAVFTRVAAAMEEGRVEAWRDFLAETPRRSVSDLDRALILARMAELTVEEMGVEWMDADDCEEVEEYYAESIRESPLPETYRSWYQFRCRAQTPRLEVAEAWHRHFPADQEALFLLLEAARHQAGDVSLAYQSWRKLKEILGPSPRLEAMGPFVVLEYALYRHRQGGAQEAAALIEDLPDASVVVGVAKDCARWLMAGKDRKTKIAVGRRLGAAEQPYLVLHCFTRLDPGFAKTSLSASVKAQLDDADMTVNSFLTMAAIEDGRWQLAGEVPCAGKFETAFTASALSSQTLLSCLSALRRLDPALEDAGKSRLAMALTVNGLQRDDPRGAAFLAYRALVYHSVAEAYSTTFSSVSADRYADMAEEVLAVAARIAPDSGEYRQLLESIGVVVGTRNQQDAGRKISKRLVKGVVDREKRVTHLLAAPPVLAYPIRSRPSGAGRTAADSVAGGGILGALAALARLAGIGGGPEEEDDLLDSLLDEFDLDDDTAWPREPLTAPPAPRGRPKKPQAPQGQQPSRPAKQGPTQLELPFDDL